MNYLTYNPATGELTGSFNQELPEDVGAYIVVSPEQSTNWCSKKVNLQTLLLEDAVSNLLPQHKIIKNVQINQWRAEANMSTFPFSGKLIACDQLSRSDLDAIATTIALSSSFPPSFPMAWKATDNTYVMLPDVAAFKNMYAAMVAQGTVNFTHSQSLKAALAAASTEDQVAAIVWGA